MGLAQGPGITNPDVIDAIIDARTDLDAGLYTARWQRATRAEQRLMPAMASSAERRAAKMSDLVAALGKAKLSDLSPARKSLINKGLVYASDRGELAFTVPGMATFATRQVIR